jgi:hypothetical protein
MRGKTSAGRGYDAVMGLPARTYRRSVVQFIGYGLFTPGTWVTRAGYPKAGLVAGCVLIAATICVDHGGWLARFAAATCGLLVLSDAALGLVAIVSLNRGHRIERRTTEITAALVVVALTLGGGALLAPFVEDIPPKAIREAATAAAREAVEAWKRAHQGKVPCDARKAPCVETKMPPPPPTDS